MAATAAYAVKPRSFLVRNATSIAKAHHFQLHFTGFLKSKKDPASDYAKWVFIVETNTESQFKLSII